MMGGYFGDTMISENDKIMIVKYAKKYKLSRVILFGSSKERIDANDIDIGVKGLAPELFFDFCWELYRDLSKPVDVIDLSKDCSFNRLVEQEGVVLYG
jgi:predicted nucleotidyltransferase